MILPYNSFKIDKHENDDESTVNEGNDVIFEHQKIQTLVVVYCLPDLLLCVSLSNRTLLQDLEIDAQVGVVFALLPDHLENLRNVVVHRLAVFLQSKVLLAFLHYLQALQDIHFADLFGKSEASLNNKLFTLAWQSRMRASRLRVVVYLSPLFLMDCCS